MSGEVPVTIVGGLADNPELRHTQSGVSVLNMRVLQTPRIKQGDEWVDGETMGFNVTAWRDLADNAAGALSKGSQVVIIGKLKVRTYDRNDGSKGTSLDVEAEHIGIRIKSTKQQGQQQQRQQQPPTQREDWSQPTQSSGYDSDLPF